MHLPFGHRRPRLDELNEQIAELRVEIAALEESLGASQEGIATGGSLGEVGHIRASIADQELVAKREELDALLAQATKLEAAAPQRKPVRGGRGSGDGDQGPEDGAGLLVPGPRPLAPHPRSRRPLLLGGAAAVLLLAGLAAGALMLLRPGFVDGLLSRTFQAPATAEPARRIAAQPVTVEISPLIPTRLAAQVGETFFTGNLDVSYGDGPVVLSGPPAPDGTFFVDDALDITVVRPDGSRATWNRTFNINCLENSPLGPQDVTDLFRQGLNKVSVILRDVCGSTIGTQGPIFLTYVPG